MDTKRETISGRFLVRGGRNSSPQVPHPDPSDRIGAKDQLAPLLISDTPISFWGGIDPITGIIIDQQHPLYQQCISNVILCIPSGRGSCTTSQVLLELILNCIAPRAIIVRDLDALLCIGAIIAKEFFPSSNHSICDILHIGSNNFNSLLHIFSNTCDSQNNDTASPHGSIHGQSLQLYGRILASGEFQIHALSKGDEAKSGLCIDDFALK
jgi:predicted aconitase with swiveling domain